MQYVWAELLSAPQLTNYTFYVIFLQLHRFQLTLFLFLSEGVETRSPVWVSESLYPIMADVSTETEVSLADSERLCGDGSQLVH